MKRKNFDQICRLRQIYPLIHIQSRWRKIAMKDISHSCFQPVHFYQAYSTHKHKSFYIQYLEAPGLYRSRFSVHMQTAVYAMPSLIGSHFRLRGVYCTYGSTTCGKNGCTKSFITTNRYFFESWRLDICFL